MTDPLQNVYLYAILVLELKLRIVSQSWQDDWS